MALRRIHVVALICVFGTSAHHARVAPCHPGERVDKQYWRNLRTELREPHFYFVSPIHVVYVSQDFIRNHSADGTIGHAAAKRLVAAIRSAEPLTEHTDIHKGLLNSKEILQDVTRLVGAALQAGDAAAIYIPEHEKLANRVSVLEYDDGCNRGRVFSVGADEELVLAVVDDP